MWAAKIPNSAKVIIGNTLRYGEIAFRVKEQDKKIYAREQIRLELTLKSAKDLQKDNEKIICMMHYPPTNSNWEESEFTKLFEKYGVSAVCYGHLHGPYVKREIIKKINNITYYLTSCDQLANKLIEIKV